MTWRARDTQNHHDGDDAKASRYGLSHRQVLFFRHNGYLKVPTQLPEATCQELTRVTQELFQDGDEPIRRNSDGEVVRVSNVLARNPIIREVFESNVLLDPLEGLIGPNIELLSNRHNHATRNIGTPEASRLHRDVLQWANTIVCAMVYLEDSTIAAGCTELVPGSHLLPFVGTPNNGGTWMDEHSIYSDLIQQVVPVPMPAGGILLFDGVIFHRAGHNSGPTDRLALTMAYRPVDELAMPTESLQHRRLVRGERLYRGNLP